MQEASKTTMGDRDAEDMQDYLARMNRQLLEMQNHFQSVAPRREGLARATERYLQRKASVTDPAPSAGAVTAPVSLSAQSSVCRRQSSEDAVPGPSIHPQPHSTANMPLPKYTKHCSEPGIHPDSASAASSASVHLPAVSRSSSGSSEAEVLHRGHRHNAAPATPPRPVSKDPSWEPHSERGPPPQQQASQARLALFHSPQRKRGQLSRAASDSGSSRGMGSKQASSSLAAAFEAAAACAEEVEGSRVCIVSRNASEAGSRAGSRLPSFKWQQPTPSTTPEKAGRKAGKQKPPRSRALSQGGFQQQQQQPTAKLTASTSSSKLPALHGNSNSSSPSSSRSMRRFASTGGVYGSGRISDSECLSEDSSSAVEAAPTAAAAASVKIASNSPEDPQSEHELFAVINDAMEAAAAAVNKPDVLIGSPSARRLTADDATVGRSSSESGSLGVSQTDRALKRYGSSLRGLAVAAAGWARPDDRASAAVVSQEDSCGYPKQQQQQQAEAQELNSKVASHPQNTAEAGGAAEFSVDGLGASELTSQSPAYTDKTVPSSEQDTPDESETAAAGQEAVHDNSPAAAAAAPAGSGCHDAAALVQPEETPWPRLGSPGGAGVASSSSSSPWRQAVSDSGYTQQQQQGTPDRQQLAGPCARRRWATPTKDKQQQQQTGTPTKQQHSWTPTKPLQTLKTWFSEVRRSPLKNDPQHSPIQNRRHVSDSGFDAAAAAAAGSTAQHSRAPSVGNLLSSGGLEDMPLHLLGQSGSVRTRSSAGSQLSTAQAAVAAAAPDTPRQVGPDSTRSSGNGSSSDLRFAGGLDGQQQQPVGSTTPSKAAVPASSASADHAPIAAAQDVTAAAAMHSSAPGLLESSPEPHRSSTATSSSMEAAEQDEVLFGSPSGSPASSHSQLQLAMKLARPATATRFSMDPAAAAAAAAAVEVGGVCEDGSDWGRDSWQQQQHGDDADEMMLLASPTGAAAAAGRGEPDVALEVDSLVSDSDMGSPTAAAAAAAAAGAGSSDHQGPEREQIIDVEPRAQDSPLRSSSSSSSSSFEISTDLGSSSGSSRSTSSLGDDLPMFADEEVGIDHGRGLDESSPTSSQIKHLLQQIEKSAADLGDAHPQHRPAAAAASGAGAAAADRPIISMTSFKISISPEASLVEEDSDLQQQQQQQQSWHPAGAAAAAAAAAGLAGHANFERSFMGHDPIEPSGDIVVEGHSMQLPEQESRPAVDTQEPAIAATEIVHMQAAAQRQQPQQQQQQTAASQSQAVRQSEIEVALPEEPLQQQQQSGRQQQQQQAAHVTGYVSNSGAKAAPTSPAAAKPSWGERMLGKLTSALKGSSNGRQRVKGGAKTRDATAAAAAAATPPGDAEEPQVHGSYGRGVSDTQDSMQRQQQQHQQQQQQGQTPLSPVEADSQPHALVQPAMAATPQQQDRLGESEGPTQDEPAAPVDTSEPAAGTLLTQPGQPQQQQHQQLHQQQGLLMLASGAASSSGGIRSEPARIFQLARAAAVAVAGVGVAAVQGTPAPHLVSCGSTLHAPTLAAVSLLLASSSCTSSSSSGASPAVLAAAAAASLAIAAAAVVAAWELEGGDLAVFSESDVNMSPNAAAGHDDAYASAGISVVDIRTSNSVSSDVPAAVDYDMGHLLTPGAVSVTEMAGSSSSMPTAAAAAAASRHPASHSHNHSAAGAKAPASPETFPTPVSVQSAAADLNGTSSSNTTGLPELLSDVSKAQYSRPGSAFGYDARRYTEPVSPMQALSGDTAVSGAAVTGSSLEVQQLQQQSQVQQQQQQLPRWAGQDERQQQQQHRKQLSGTSWSGQSSPKTADVVWMPQKANLWDSNQQQQQQQQGADHHTTHPSAVTGGSGGSSSRALSAVQQLKQRQLNRRSSIGAVSNSSGGAEVEIAAAGVALHTVPQQQQQQQQEHVQHQLPSVGQSELCLGHGVMGELTDQQQQQQWHTQQQQQSPMQELSCTDYYRQLVQQQQALEQQREQHSCSHHPRVSQQGIHTAPHPHPPPPAAAAAAAASNTDGAAAGSARQLSALAKLRQQRQRRMTQQHSFNSNGPAAAAATALRSNSAAAHTGEWGSAGGAEQQQQESPDRWTQHPPAVRTAWGDTTTAAQEYIPQQQQQQQQADRESNNRSSAAATSPDPAAAAAAGRSGHNRGWSSDTGAGVAGDLGPGDTAAAAGSGGGGSKPYLKRRSRTIVSQKLDWSNVQSRTIHKLDDRCIPPAKSRNAANSRPSYDPALAAAQRRAGLMEPRGKAAAAAAARGITANRHSPQSGYEAGYEMERHSSTYYRPKSKGQGGFSSANGDGVGSQNGPTAGAVHRQGSGRSRIPTAPVPGFSGTGGYDGRHGGGGVTNSSSAYAAPAAAGANTGVRSPLKSGGSLQQGSGVQRQLSGRRSSGGFGGSGLDPEAPLDDLLSHVNNLIKEFDRMYK